MRRLLFTITAMLVSCTTCLAQVSTMGSTAMGLSSTPGAIVTSPLNGPGPFSATTQPGTPVTTLAPVPLALDPTATGTSVNCSPGSAQTTSSFPTQTTSSAPVTANTSGGATSSTFAAPPGTIEPLGTIVPQGTIVILPQGTIVPPGTIIETPGASVAPGTSVASTSTTPPMPLGPSATTSTPISGSATGTIAPITVLGSSTVTGTCSLGQGNPSVNGAALPLFTPEIPSSPPPGTIEPAVAPLGDTSIDPTTTVMPTPNTSACAESMTMNLSTPGTMAPANATGAAATPGVSPASPPGC
jgi:hypothetical protein